MQFGIPKAWGVVQQQIYIILQQFCKLQNLPCQLCVSTGHSQGLIPMTCALFLLSRQLFVVLCKYNIRTGLCDCKTNYKHLFTSKVLTSMSLLKLKIYLEFTKICLKMCQLYLKQVCDLAHCKIHKLSLSNLSTSKQHILKTIGCI